MVKTGYQVTLSLTVDDPTALWTAAATLAMASPGMTMRDVTETLGPVDAPQLDDCLAMLLQPERFVGCAVQSLAVLAVGDVPSGAGRASPSGGLRAASCDRRLPPSAGNAVFRSGYVVDPV